MGWFGAGLASVMVPLGITTAIVMARFDTVQLHQSGANAFLSVPFYDMIAFGVLVALAIYWRTKPELHRRLIFIATCGLMDAPVARFDYVFDNNLFFPCLDLLILLGVARDLLVERRVHKAYRYALPILMLAKASRYTCGGTILPGGRGSRTQSWDSRTGLAFRYNRLPNESGDPDFPVLHLSQNPHPLAQNARRVGRPLGKTSM